MKRMWALMAVASVVFATPGCEREKERLDAEVRRLCALDGGVKVYETVTLERKVYEGLLNRYGELEIRSKELAKQSDAFYLESTSKHFRTGNPEMWRSEFRIVRRSDGKVLASSIYYTRRGGDLPGPRHESFFICPDTKINTRIADQVIKRAN